MILLGTHRDEASRIPPDKADAAPNASSKQPGGKIPSSLKGGFANVGLSTLLDWPVKLLRTTFVAFDKAREGLEVDLDGVRSSLEIRLCVELPSSIHVVCPGEHFLVQPYGR